MDINKFQYQGQILQKKECRRKADNSVWGYSILVAQLGETCEFIMPDIETWKRVSEGEMVLVEGHLQQRGYNLDIRTDKVTLAKQAAKQSA